MRIALLGLPQSGKRTLFTLLTGRQVPEGRKPGEVVEGTAAIADPRIDRLSELCQPERRVYALNNFVLCPDMVEGGSREWLDAARRCDLLCLVVRAFESDNVYHPAGSVDSERDRDNLDAELVFADMEIAEKRLVRLEKEKRAGLTPEQATEERALGKCMAALEVGKRAADVKLEAAEEAAIRSLGFVTMLPVLRAYNVSEDALETTMEHALVVSAKIEQEIAAIEDAPEREEYLAAIGLTDSGLDRMNRAAYDALGLMSYYTVGEDECRAWTIRKGSLAPTAGGKIHSDIERGFIRVEVTKYDDFVAAGSEKAAKDQGRIQTRGKDYVIEDGDICHFLFSV